MDAVTRVPAPVNEPVRQYQPGSADRAIVEARIKELAGQRTDLTMTIGGRQVMGGGERVPVVAPHAFRRVLGDLGNATDEVKARASLDEAAYAVTPRQQQRIIDAAQGWLVAHPEHAEFELRFDAMLIAPRSLPRHVLAAFDAST